MCRVMKGGGAVGPCMYYHIGKCAGPCSGKVTREEYDHNQNAQADHCATVLGEIAPEFGERTGPRGFAR